MRGPSRKRVRPVGQCLQQPVGEQARQGGCPSRRVGAGQRQRPGGDRARGAAQRGEHKAPGFSHGASVRGAPRCCPKPRLTGRARRAIRRPAAPLGPEPPTAMQAALAAKRAPTARGTARRAHQRPQFHERDGGLGCDRGLGREHPVERLPQQPIRRSRAVREEAGEKARHIRIEYWLPAAKGEGRDGCCRVGPDAGQGAQGVQIVGDVPGVLAVDHCGGGVEAQGAARVPEAPPGADRLARQVRCQRPWGGPSSQPCRIDRQHPGHRCLLQHHLADEHRPGPDVGPPPRQVPGGFRVPGEGAVGGGGRPDSRSSSRPRRRSSSRPHARIVSCDAAADRHA